MEKMIHKMIALSLVLIMAAVSLPVFASDNDASEVYYDFSENGLSKNLEMVSQEQYEKAVKDGRQGAYIAAGGRMAFDIDNSVDLQPVGGAVEVTVEYFDEDWEGFGICYNTSSGPEQSELVYVENSQQWRTATFVLNDLNQSNQYYDGDFAIELDCWEYGAREYPLLVGKVSVKLLPPKNVSVSVETPRAGRVFANGEDITFDVTFKNELKALQNAKVKYTASDYENGEALWTGEDSITLKKNGIISRSVTVPAHRFGRFVFTVESSDSSGKYGYKENFRYSYTAFDTKNMPANKAMGSCVHFILDERKSELVAPLMAAAGLNYTRDEIWWASYVKTPGVYKMTANDEKYLRDIEKSGLEKLTILGYINAVCMPGKENQSATVYPETEEELQAWEDYCYNLAKELGDRCTMYEVWNEPDPMHSKQYAQTLKRAYIGVKKGNPNAKVIGGAFAGTQISMTRELLEEGYGDYMDGISFHIYRWEKNAMDEDSTYFYDEIARFVNTVNEYKPMDIYVTEFGWSLALKPMTQFSIRDNFLKIMTVFGQFPQIKGTFWYEFQNGGSHMNAREHNFGLVDNWLRYSPYAANSAYCAMAAYNAIIGNAKVSDKYENEKTYIYRFTKNYRGNDTMMLWREGGDRTVSLNLDCEKITLYDSYGNPTEVTSENGVFSFVLGQEPIMAEGRFGNDKIELALSETAAKNDVIEAVSGDVVSYTADIPEGSTLEAEPSRNMEVVSVEGNTVQLKVTGEVGYESYLKYKAVKDGEAVGFGNVCVRIIELMKSKLYMLPFIQNMLCLSVKNNSNNPLSGTFKLTNPMTYVGNIPEVSFNAEPVSESRTYFYLPTGRNVYLNITGELKTDRGDAETLKYHFDNGEVSMCKTAPVIDGVISEGEYSADCALNTIGENYDSLFDGAYGGENDLSVKYYVTFDEKNLYLAVDVIDDVHYQVEPNMTLWKGDCMQFAFSSMDGSTFREVQVSKRADEVVVSGYDRDAYPMQVAVERKGKNTVYEIAFPIAGLFGEDWDITKQEEIRFSALVNDNDGPDIRSPWSGRKGWIEFGSGIGREKDRSLYAVLKLKK